MFYYTLLILVKQSPHHVYGVSSRCQWTLKVNFEFSRISRKEKVFKYTWKSTESKRREKLNLCHT